MTTPTPAVAALMVRLGDVLGQAVRPSSQAQELQRVVVGLRALFSAAACSCALTEPDSDRLLFVAADGAGAEQILGVRLPMGSGIAGWTVMSGQPIAIADVTEDPRFAREVAESTSYVPQTILAAPLVGADGTVLGVLEVLDPSRREEHAGRDLDLLSTIATMAASLVRLSGVYDALGSELLRMLTPEGEEAKVEAALEELAAEPQDGDVAGLRGVAASFYRLATADPSAAVLAQRVLAEVASYARSRP